MIKALANHPPLGLVQVEFLDLGGPDSEQSLLVDVKRPYNVWVGKLKCTHCTDL
jgi:hypothetical protein